MTPTTSLSEFIASTSFDDLPPEVVAAAKVAIMDGVSVMVAGSAEALSGIASQYVRELGGTPVSSVVGPGFRTNPPAAAFANGIAGHCLDFEIQGFPPTHGTSSCLPAALALAESLGATGKDIITAYVLGWEVQGRLRAASAHATNPAYHPPGLVGPPGAAAAASKVMGLGAEGVHMALAIAASRTGGLTANTGTMVKSTHPGNAARMGTEAAMLAKAGFTATRDILEVRNGYAAALFNGDMHWDVVAGELGKSYRLTEPGFNIKRFPAQIHMQNPTETVINLRARHGLRPEQVKALEVRTGSTGHSGSIPRSGLDGKFSLDYCTAAALLDGKVDIHTFTDERRFAQDMEDMLPKVSVQLENPGSDETTAIARLLDGTELSETCKGYTGSASNPMGRDLHLTKVRTCLQAVLSEEAGEALIAKLEALEDITDVSQLMRDMSPPN